MTSLHKLAKMAGIQPAYTDVFGNEHHAPDETLALLLEALGFPPEDKTSSEALNAFANPQLPLSRVLNAGQTSYICVEGAKDWKIISETGETQQAKAERGHIILPPLHAGYYRLQVSLADSKAECFLLVAPPECWLPKHIQEGKRIWGVSTQTYSLHSNQSLGMGNFSDLTYLAERAAALGVDVLGINPLSASFPSNPSQISPYSPSSRLFLNWLYIDVEAVDGFTESAEIKAVWANEAFQQKITDAREAKLVDYKLVAEIKRRLLEPLFAWFTAQGDRTAFKAFCEAGGKALHNHALFDALSEYFAGKNGKYISFLEWPEIYRSPDASEVAAFGKTHASRVEFYLWLQWIADTQLKKVQDTALEKGMALGLYRDLAVGSDSAGAEVWLDRESFIPNASVGAPPDEYNPMGQNWGLPALNPLILKKRNYQPFIELLRANMKYAGALRIDHAFGLSRLFLIPKNASHGAYLHYPFEELLAILKIESHRSQCLIIGEDLGTFPPGYKEVAAATGVFSYRVLYFERDKEGGFLPPDRYPEKALSTLSTHDLPTLAGWLEGTDMDERAKLKLYPKKDLEKKERQGREKDKPRLMQALKREGLRGDNLAENVQRFLARSPSAIVMVQLEDILSIKIQANLPGTVDERPNWRMKLLVPLEKLSQDARLGALATAMKEERTRPLITYARATYRLQFHKGFTFFDAARIIPYLAKLGVSHVYASPYMKARAGSTHGYDITDHNSFNPELGGEEGYLAYSAALKKHGLRQILDFVPNHMGIGADSAFWMDVLEWGKASPYAKYFDINWEPGKLLLPVLGAPYGEVLANGELKIEFHPATGSFSLCYFENTFPLCPHHYFLIDEAFDNIEVGDIEQGDALKAQLAKNAALHPAIEARIAEINADRESLDRLIEHQHYRLAFWREANKINYRRFFDINELAGLRMEDADVFAATHQLLFSLIDKGELHGVRIDHIDGLADPAGYCRNLREKIGAGTYLVVEKILETGEPLRTNWQINGTSGYDALVELNALFVADKNEQAFTDAYSKFTGNSKNFEDTVYKAKKELLELSFSSELSVLTKSVQRIAGQNAYTRDYPQNMLEKALCELIACFPVYRSYVTNHGADAEDARVIGEALEQAKKREAILDESVYDFIASLLLGGNRSEEAANFIRKFQQLTGPVMAKGLEDTSFYRYFRLISLNEVGGNPGEFGVSLVDFHAVQKKRASNWPHSMIASSTHDTKRGEDVRARLNALSHMPKMWGEWVTQWAELNAPLKQANAPSANEEYFIYQTLLASWPNELMHWPLDAQALKHYQERLVAYFTKALREAKLHTSWHNPNEAHESAVLGFVANLLDAQLSVKFLQNFIAAAAVIAEKGMRNSLVQTALKLTLPGVPDIYQGAERWDLSLVDPDNRRPVDYTVRTQALASQEPLEKLITHWQDGAVKQRLLERLLTHRAEFPDLYTYGSYEPLETGSDAVIAYRRSYQDQEMLVIGSLGAQVDENATITLSGEYRNLLTGEDIVTPRDGMIGLSSLLNLLPVAVLVRA